MDRELIPQHLDDPMYVTSLTHSGAHTDPPLLASTDHLCKL